MGDVMLVYDPAMASYDLGPWHPLRPERFTLAVSLMRALGLLAEDGAPSSSAALAAGSGARARVVAPAPAEETDLLRVHDARYVEAVKRASADPGGFVPAMGLGSGDNPVSAGMHEAAALICGGAIAGLRAVLSGQTTRSFNVAGGLHHAHRSRAAGFCVYNDPAVAIAAALETDPGLRLAYVDVDAHHGDGVQEAFYAEPRVLTASVHESGAHLFPGTGFADETGAGAGAGTALNVPMPPLATDACYELAMRDAVEPAVRSFSPDAIVAQLGADSHHADPLTTLGLTLPGYRSVVRRVVALADELCGGRLAASGGGGYGAYSVVPRAWACALGELLGVEPAEELPAAWREEARAAAGGRDPGGRLTDDDLLELAPGREALLLEQAAASVARVRRVSPLLA
ncbi:MAG: acetoin utilization protein AcuC [Coriobacteriia bacterium]|nr:acetoin utilization protein AcuC [Coriobacteriia bacterium]